MKAAWIIKIELE